MRNTALPCSEIATFAVSKLKSRCVTCASCTVKVSKRKDHQLCANWVHCKRRGSEKSTFLVIFWGLLIFSGAPAIQEFHYKTFKFN